MNKIGGRKFAGAILITVFDAIYIIACAKDSELSQLSPLAMTLTGLWATYIVGNVAQKRKTKLEIK